MSGGEDEINIFDSLGLFDNEGGEGKQKRILDVKVRIIDRMD